MGLGLELGQKKKDQKEIKGTTKPLMANLNITCEEMILHNQSQLPLTWVPMVAPPTSTAHFLPDLLIKYYTKVASFPGPTHAFRRFPYCKQWKAGRGLGTELAPRMKTVHTLAPLALTQSITLTHSPHPFSPPPDCILWTGEADTSIYRVLQRQPGHTFLFQLCGGK